MITNGQVDHQQAAIEKTHDNIGDDSPNDIHHETAPDALLDTHPALAQESNDSGLNLINTNQMHLFSELDNSPLQYHGSSIHING